MITSVEWVINEIKIIVGFSLIFLIKHIGTLWHLWYFNQPEIYKSVLNTNLCIHSQMNWSTGEFNLYVYILIIYTDGIKFIVRRFLL